MQPHVRNSPTSCSLQCCCSRYTKLLVGGCLPRAHLARLNCWRVVLAHPCLEPLTATALRCACRRCFRLASIPMHIRFTVHVRGCLPGPSVDSYVRLIYQCAGPLRRGAHNGCCFFEALVFLLKQAGGVPSVSLPMEMSGWCIPSVRACVCVDSLQCCRAKCLPQVHVSG